MPYSPQTVNSSSALEIGQDTFFFVDASNGNLVLDLSDLSQIANGLDIKFKRMDTSSNSVLIRRSQSTTQTFDDGTTNKYLNVGQTLYLIADEPVWRLYN